MQRQMVVCSAIWLFFIIIQQITAAPPSLDPSANRYVVLPEDTPVGTVIKTFNITDVDPGDHIRVLVTDPITTDYVTFNQTQGNTITVDVMLRQILDRDRGTTNVRLRFSTADDQGNMNHAIGTVFTQVSADDLDGGFNGYITYSMQPGARSATSSEEYNTTFSISNTTGQISLLESLDYEKNSYYQFTIIAQDMAPPYHRVSSILIIHVVDVQDTPPFFTGIPYRTTVSEHISVGSSVLMLAATDGDPAVANEVDFQILDGDCTTFFSVNRSGILTTTNDLDRDSGEIRNNSGVCSFTVQAYEINSTQPQYGNTTAETTVTIIIADIDDNKPAFLNTSIFQASVYENSPAGFPIAFDNFQSMVIEDLDQGKNAKMHISLTSPLFSVTPTVVYGSGSLVIKVADASSLDREKQEIIQFQALVGGPNDRYPSAVATVTVRLLDENDNFPWFLNANHPYSAYENSAIGTLVAIIMATDLDQGLNGMVRYTLSGDYDRFMIDSSSGEITLVGSLDAEAVSEHHIMVTATDGGGLTSTAPLTIHVLDINDNAPTFQTNNYRVLIKENDIQYNSTPVAVMQATDADITAPNNLVTYSFKSFSEKWMHTNMTIDNQTGEIFLKSPIDFEQLENTTGVPGELTAIVEATDQGLVSFTSQTMLTLIVQDVAEEALSSTTKAVPITRTMRSTIRTSHAQAYSAASLTTTGQRYTSSGSFTTLLPTTVDTSKCSIMDALKVQKLQLEIELLKTQLRKLNA